MELITNNILFGLIISLGAFEIGILLCRITKIPIFNPLLVATLLIIGFLCAFNIDFDTYNKSGQFINMFLGPSTVVLALPLYKQLELLKKNAAAIFSGILLGTVVGIISIILISVTIGLDSDMIKSLVPKSVTTPIGIAVSEQLGGIVSITVLAIVVTGIIGAVMGPTICKIFKIKDGVAVGVAIGTASHAVGTSKALEIGEIEGAMSSLSIGIAGIITVIIGPVIYGLLTIII